MAEPLDEFEEARLRKMSLRGYEPGAQQWIEGLLATLDRERSRLAQLVAVAEAAQIALDDLIWCSGSADFGPGGRAERGWDAGPRKTIDTLREALAALPKAAGS